MGDETDHQSSRCPLLVISQQGVEIARINPDRTWSVKWPMVIDQAYAEPTDRNHVPRAVCALLLAGRDNFRTTAWEQPLAAWDTEPVYIACPDEPMIGQQYKLVLWGMSGMIACVNDDASWSVNWGEVALLSSYDALIGATVGGLQTLLLAAKDNFLTKPMKF